MNRQVIFLSLRNTFVIVEQSVRKYLGPRPHQLFVRTSFKIKAKLFPEYGPYIPDSTIIDPPPNQSAWLAPKIPDWVITEMQELGKSLDPAICPSEQFLASCQYYSYPIIPKPGELYKELIDACSRDSYTHCFAIPWLKRGGADLVTLWHIRCATEIPNNKVLVLLTEPGDSPWLSKIPQGVDVIDTSKCAVEMHHDSAVTVITRLLVQLKIDVLHIINSRHTWEAVKNHGTAIRQNTRIFASLYCDDYDNDGRPVGFARDYLPSTHHHLEKVISDNAAFPKLLHDTYGFPNSLFEVIKSPASSHSPTNLARTPGNERKVLWAGRLDRQKRPDILIAIAKAMPDVKFHVYGDPTLDSHSNVISAMKKLDNIELKGKFDGAQSLPFSEFPAFLYTSQWDGTPTMVIDAALASIPLIASCVGGVGDIITADTGFPIKDINSISAYIEAIETVFRHPEAAEEKAMKAKHYVETTHTKEIFYKSVAGLPGYLSNLHIKAPVDAEQLFGSFSHDKH